MEATDRLISDKEIDKAWGNANFGDISKRDVIKGALLKCASGYHTGHTAKVILMELGLVKQSKWELTVIGKQYLLDAYSNGVSV